MAITQFDEIVLDGPQPCFDLHIRGVIRVIVASAARWVVRVAQRSQ